MLDSRYHHRRRRHHRCRRHHRYHYRHQQAIAKKHQLKPLQEMLQKISGNRCNKKNTTVARNTGDPLQKSRCENHSCGLEKHYCLEIHCCKKTPVPEKKSRENQVEFKTSNRVLTASAPAAFAALRCLGSPSGHDMRSISNCSNLL